MTNPDDLTIDLAHAAQSVILTVTVSKATPDTTLSELLWFISRAFAQTEGITVAVMHGLLRRQVKAFEDPTHLRFVWERACKGLQYSDRLREHLRDLAVAPRVH